MLPDVPYPEVPVPLLPELPVPEVPEAPELPMLSVDELEPGNVELPWVLRSVIVGSFVVVVVVVVVLCARAAPLIPIREISAAIGSFFILPPENIES